MIQSFSPPKPWIFLTAFKSYFATSYGDAPISIIKQYNRTAEHNRLEK